MSAPFADVSKAEWLTLLEANFLENCFLIVAGAVPLWDHLVTLEQEIEVIWKREWSWLTGFFAATRFLGVWFALSMLLPVANWATKPGFVHPIHWMSGACEGVTVFNMVPMLLLDVIWALFSSLRVYAVGGQARKTAILVFVLSMTPFAIDLTAYATTIFVDIQFTRFTSVCAEDSTVSVQAFDILMFVGRIPLIIADAIVLFITWKSTFRIRREAAQLNMASPLTTMLLRDGTFYFVSAFNVNVFQMVLFLYSARYPIASYFVPIVTPVIVTRFLLNLRKLRDNGGYGGASTTLARSATLHFAADLAAETNGTCGIGAYPDVEDSLCFAGGSSSDEGGLDHVEEVGMSTFADSEGTWTIRTRV